MNKPNKISIGIASALYAASMAAVSSGVTEPTFKPMPDFLKKVEITQQMKTVSDSRKERANRLDKTSKPAKSTPQTNVHRAVAKKIDFKWDNDVTGVNTYIIEFNEQPVALYDGRVSGFSATNTRNITGIPSLLTTTDSYKINVNDTHVINYKNYLEQKQQQHLSAVTNVVGNKAQARQTYQYALNGASMQMTQQQALSISKLSGVRNITLSKNYELNTDIGPKHINADQIWTPNTLGLANKGEGIVVGIIDTGINSDHPSFAATAGDGYVHTNPRDQYYGDCQKEEFASMCNDKLIGVHSYPVITDTYWSPAFQDGYGWWETPENPVRPENGEDYGGHGSHTASTTAGNELYDVPYTISVYAEQHDGIATDLVFPHVSGVAPRANIISYKVCYDGDGSMGDQNMPTDQWTACPGEAIIAGIEDAIADGVDVINFSIGGGESSPWESPMEMAFLAAREAGISASLSAGNSGNFARDHVSPWVTSVAATTHGRTISYSEKTLGEFSGGDPLMTAPGYGNPLVGAGYTEGFTGNIVLAASFTDPDPWDGFDAEMCNKPFPADTFTADQIVVCKRGDIARVEKAINVQAGGAGGFILYNADYTQDAPWGTSEPNDPYVIPGILLPSNVNYSLIPWLQAGTGHMGTINASSMNSSLGEADYVADFSSRGPSVTTPDSMIPNVGAPGVDVFAAFADDHPFTTTPFSADYTAMSGTSMAAPHVAGAMALLTQLHPDWSPAEIQSALMMTAHSGTAVHPFGPSWGSVAAGVDDTGSGIIDVEAASRASLVMDETGENYRSANPNNGGNLTALNEAYLFNTSCDFNCSWIRTFRATEDGSWHITMAEQAADGLPLLGLSANPATFSLKKGEVQSVQFTASAQDINAMNGALTDQQFEGTVTITPENVNMPSQHMPLRVQFNDDGLPNDLSIDMHRNSGSALSPKLYTKEAGSIKVHGLVKGQTQVHSLVPYSLGMGTPEDLAADAGIEQISFTVPEGTKRLVFEIIKQEGYTTAHDTAIDIGRDANGDGLVQWYDEAICYSFSYARDFCAIDYPEAGEYWALVGNYTIYDHNNPGDKIDPLTITTSLAIIPEGSDDSLTATVIGDANGIDGYNIDMAWDTTDTQEGDVYYAAIELGRDSNNSSDVGIMGVRFEQKGDDVILTSSQTMGKTGDVVDFYLEAKENLSPTDRDFTLTATVPDGMNLSHDSVSINSAYADMLTIDGNTITISGVQTSTAMTPRQYVWTTSENDPLCVMPYADDDNQENWWDMSWYMWPTIIEGGAWDTFYLDTWNLSNTGSITHYGQKWEGTMGLSPVGFFFVDPTFYMNFSHAPMKYVEFPDTMIAALWHGNAVMPTPGFNWMTGETKGMYVATTANNEIILQWDGMEINDWWTGMNGSYSVQTIFKTEPDYNEGAYEVRFGYKRLDESLNGQGSIGTRGYHGHRNPWGPNEGWNADTFAYDDVLDKTGENVLVCGDYNGPEQSAIRVNFSALVNNSAPGSDLQVKVTSDYSAAEQITLTSDIKVNANISMGQYNDMTIDENAMVEGLAVLFAETNTTEKVITVSGDNISGSANGNTSGSTIDITPTAHWYGETEVMITVADAENANDSATASFMLTVVSDGVELGCMDNEATNYDAMANTDDGSCTYPAPAPTPDPEPKPKKSGGTMAWLLLLSLPLLFNRQKKLFK